MSNEAFFPEYTAPNSELSRSRRRREKQLAALITLGIPQILNEHIKENAESICTDLFGEVSVQVAEERKNYARTLTELICRTGAEAGLAAETVHTISEDTQKLLSTVQTPEMLWECVRDMLIYSCSAVYSCKTDGLSQAVKACCDHIHAGIQKSFSLTELGKVCHRAPRYVSDLFRKETGMGALQYVYQLKMQYARYLLEYSESGIREIASSLTFASHSSFSMRFKETFGITPHEYRRMFK